MSKKGRSQVRNAMDSIIARKDTIGKCEYLDTSLEAIYFSEGRATPGEGQAFSFEYTITDHLGNGRVWWRWDEATNQPVVLQRADYYPFGLEQANSDNIQIGIVNNYKYNGKELDTDHDLNWYHYGFRIYDPILGRFPSLDPIADEFPHVSPYNYAENAPINSIDLWGLQRWIVNGREITRPASQLARKSTEGALMVRDRTMFNQLRPRGNPDKHNTVATVSNRIATYTTTNFVHEGDGDNFEPGVRAGGKNALKHTLIAATAASEYGGERTREALNAHEGVSAFETSEIDMSGTTVTNSEQLADQIVDVMNNDIGIAIGTAEGNENASSIDIAQQVLDVFRSEGLWVANRTDDGTFEFSRQKLTRRQYNQMSSALDELNNNGRTEEQ